MARGSLEPVRMLGNVQPPWNATEYAASLLTFPDNAGINVWRFGSKQEPVLASTTDEMVFQGFALSSNADYTGPVRFAPPTETRESLPKPAGQAIRTSKLARASQMLRRAHDQASKAAVLRAVACAAARPDGTPAGAGCVSGSDPAYAEHSRALHDAYIPSIAPAAGILAASPVKFDAGALRGLPPTSVLSTAHPHYDVSDDSISYNIAGVVNPLALVDPQEHHSIVLYKVGRGPTAVEGLGSGGLVASAVAEVPTRGLKYLHSFAITPSYAVVVLWPCHIDVLGLALGNPVLRSIQWDGDKSPGEAPGLDTRTRVIAIRLSDGAVVVNATTDPYFAYHHINAFETTDEDTGETTLTVDTAAFNDTGTMMFWEMANIRNESYRNSYPDNTRIRRLLVSVPPGNMTAAGALAGQAAGSVAYHDIEAVVTAGRSTVTLDGQPPAPVVANGPFDGMRFSGPELPRINYGARNGRPYCFVYGYSGHAFRSEEWEEAAVIKVDLCSASGDSSNGGLMQAPASVWSVKNGYPAEPVFVSSPGAEAEDEGVLMFDMYDGPKRTSELKVVNASTLEDVCSATSPVTVPWPLHAQFFPSPESR